MGVVDKSPAHARQRMAATRAAARRREAQAVLRLAAQMAAYAAEQVGNGLTPEQARLAVVEVAGELGDVAAQLRRLARVGSAERRHLAQLFAGLGMSQVEIARRLGVSRQTAWAYVHARPDP